ncbi:methyltransferase, FxLD system [Bailinhaonella thermotolerans]|uniref:Protein-L-isoaspartate O-methyltransferase n=1 Tax=Bailinhaonella thermotolerans TaxID=1070861 RepID=A0A3A4A5N9_9ACTN|nr:methyltransferase, FxLD system [Bailinhaonella thermotolerans]RJL23221.1 methyltransferase, FxLD system [Bailinhaonella thermotolerans]
MSDRTPASARVRGQLADALIERIRALGRLRSRRVEEALRAVPRHVFVPDVELEVAYARRPVITKRAPDGTALSSASSPDIVAAMLEQSDVQPGARVLEIGTATGFNAALLAELAGASGQVTSIEIDHDLADGARTHLAAAGYPQVEVVCGDGALGAPQRAPFDRILVTAGAWDIPAAWWDQLAIGGRLVVPLRLHGSGLTRSLAFERPGPGHMISVSAEVCGFVPMRGLAAAASRTVDLAHGVTLTLDTADAPNETALTRALTSPARERWTGIVIGDRDPVQHLDLWLVTTAPVPFARLSVSPAAREQGLAATALRWSGAALYDGGALAYLALRPHPSGGQELGLIAHGPGADVLAEHTAALLGEWDTVRPTTPVITIHPALTPDDQLPAGYRVDRPAGRFTIAW